jgi:hypothetical protein
MILLAAAAAAVGSGARAGRPADLQVTLDFEGGGVIPKGRLAVYLDGPGAGRDETRLAAATSSGGSRKITLSLFLPPGMDRTPPRQVVALLERADGWLLARGSAQLEGGGPVVITLYTVMY